MGLGGGDGKGGYPSTVCLGNRSQVSLEYLGLSPQRILSSTGPCEEEAQAFRSAWMVIVSTCHPGIITTSAPFTPQSAPVSTISYMVPLPNRLVTESTSPVIVIFRCFFQGCQARGGSRSACVHKEKAVIADTSQTHIIHCHPTNTQHFNAKRLLPPFI